MTVDWAAYRSGWLDQPIEVSIETFSKCNARCTFCPYPELERINTKMSDEMLDRLVGELSAMKRTRYVSPFKVNEPLLDKRLIPLCERINEECPHIQIRIFTNGSPLTPDKIEAIGKLKNVAHLWISLNSHIPEEYEQLMGLNFERTAANLDYLHSIDFPHPVMLSAVGFPNEPFRRYCFERWPDFNSMAIKKDAWIDFTDPQSPEVPDAPCMRWFELSIMADGRVSLCCMDGKGEHTIGDLNAQTMLEVYNAPFWRERREKMLSRKAVDDPCNRCSY